MIPGTAKDHHNPLHSCAWQISIQGKNKMQKWHELGDGAFPVLPFSSDLCSLTFWKLSIIYWKTLLPMRNLLLLQMCLGALWKVCTDLETLTDFERSVSYEDDPSPVFFN